MNTDDKERHFCAIDTADGREFRVIDHGHSLHHPHDIDTAEDVSDNQKISQSVGQNPYGYQSVDDVEPGIEFIKDVTDAQITAGVEQTFRELRSMESSDEDFVQLVENADEHKETISRILQGRRDNIREILKDKFR